MAQVADSGLCIPLVFVRVFVPSSRRHSRIENEEITEDLSEVDVIWLVIEAEGTSAVEVKTPMGRPYLSLKKFELNAGLGRARRVYLQLSVQEPS